MTKPEQFSVFVPLLKVDEEQRLVYGVMAEEVLDNSGEIFDYATSKPHFEKWSDDTFNASGGMSKGNLRVMHGSVAAGKLTDISFDDSSKRIECCAKVVDDNEWEKVLEGVYTGFSIGGRYEKRWVEKTSDGKATRYTAKPVEVSLVDKPCIPTATFQMIKKDGLVEDRLFKTVTTEDDLARKSDGGNDMTAGYTPTNDELLPVARELAKAATGDEASWVEYMVAAEEELVKRYAAKQEDEDKKKDEKPLADDERQEALDSDAGADEASPDASEKDAEKAAGAVDEADPKATSDKQKKEEAEAINPAKSDDADEDEEEMDKMKAKKADIPDLEQVWKTSDGQTFAKKSDAIEHEKALAKGESLTDLIKAAKDKLAEGSKMDAEKAEEGDYGDVEYADLGYQEDKKPRYPIDTAEHIRAAWNYIHQEKNASLYSADQVKRIKNRITRAWKDKIDEAGPPSAQKMAAFGDLSKTHTLVTSDEYLAKGMWEISRMADVLSSVACMQQCLANEAIYEGDNSPIPAKLKDAVTSLGTIMVELVAEEVGELVAGLKDGGAEGMDRATPMMALAASTLGLEKADADELGKSMIASGAIGRIQKIHDHVVSLGAKCMKEEAAPAAADDETTEKMAKFDTVLSENEMLKADLAGQKSEMAEAKSLIKSLMVDIEKIKNTPMPSAPRTHVVSKGDDATGGAPEAPDLSKFTQEQLADLAIRMAQSNGNSLLKR